MNAQQRRTERRRRKNPPPIVTEAAPQSLEDRRAEIRDAIEDLFCPEGAPAPGDSMPRSWYIVSTFDDAVIVCLDDDDLFRYPVTFDAEGEAVLGSPQKVEVTYQPIAESFGGVILGPAPLTEGKEGASKDWLCLIIEEGLSKNRRLYTADALRNAVPLFEAAQCFFTHAASTKGEPDPRDLAGFLRSPKLGIAESAGAPGRVAIMATFRSTSSRAQELLQEAFEAGNPKLFGLSINASGRSQMIRMGEGVVQRVDSIDEVDSVDIVSRPAAGGTFLRRLVAGMPAQPVTEKEFQIMESKLRQLQESRSDLFAKLPTNATEADVDKLLMQALREATQKPAPIPATGPATTAVPLTIPAPAPAPVAAAPLREGLSADDRTLLLEAKADRLLKNRTLPAPLQESTRSTVVALLEANAPTPTVEKFIEDQVKAGAQLSEPGPIGTGLGRQATEITADGGDKYAEALEGMFFSDARPEVLAEYKRRFGKDAPKSGFRSLKTAYIEATGDERVSGFMEARATTRYRALMEASKARSTRLMEAAEMPLQEAIGTASLGSAFASTMNRRLLSEYGATDLSKRWRSVVSTVQPLADFRNQERIRMGHLGDLATVAESGTYQEFTNFTDEKVSYAATKRGNILSISREAIKNDDIGVVRSIPMRVALAAARTLHKFVFNLIITNPTLDDSVALFAAATTRGFSSAGNIQTAALSKTTVNIARQRLLRVTDRDANTQLALAPKILIVPPELEEVAIQLTTNPVITTTNQNATEPNYVAQKYGLNQYIVLETMSDTNDWFILADPRVIDTIEIGFIDDQQEPLILIQDSETVGNVFSSDKWSWKVRHEYGGDVVEWRGMQGGIVP